MSSDLLKCKICPKQPRFSDVSHLLTHVGSKGHLSSLHELHIKSHQKLDAAHQLACYNQWFQQHGLAALLSQRMQQTEAKKAIKKEASRHRLDSVPMHSAHKGRKALAEIKQAPAISAYDAPPPAWKSRASTGNLHDLDSSPYRHSDYPAVGHSHLRVSHALPTGDDDDDLAELDTPIKAAPGTPQLKGVQWPGMGLFDAAPEELRRRRNQKKDGSVLRSLERNARLVAPRETVHSAAGTILKQRHMDDLEDDSPVEGEVVIQKPSPKKRKSPGLQAKQLTKKAKKDPGQTRRSDRLRRLPQTPSKAPRSSVEDLATPSSRFTLTEDESLEHKPIIRGLPKRPKRPEFTIYQVSSPVFGSDEGPSGMTPTAYANTTVDVRKLAHPMMPWQRFPSRPYDPFKLIPIRVPDCAENPAVSYDKENIPLPGAYVDPHPYTTFNPLFCQNQRFMGSATDTEHEQDRNSLVAAPYTNPLYDADTVEAIRNPLMDTSERFGNPTKIEGIGFDDGLGTFGAQYRQPLFAP